MTWHIDDTLLRRYASHDLTDARMASVEMHVTSCVDCRAVVAGRADTFVQDRVKEALDRRLAITSTGRVERGLQRLGLDEPDARLVGATLSLHGSWLAAASLVLVFATLVTMYAQQGVGLALFLVAAPLVSLAGVGLAYGPRVDPTFEIAMAATHSMLRIVLLRSLAITGPAIPVLAALSLLLPIGPLAFAWLLPAVGLAAASLALGTVVPLHRAAIALGALWLAGASVSLVGAPHTSAEALAQGIAAFRWPGQVTCAAIAVGSAFVLAVRRAEFESER